MTTKRTYSCDLCHDPIENYSAFRDNSVARTGVGIYFLPNNYLELRPLHDSEHHLCSMCILALNDLVNNVIKE